ncbi:hypothetical protein ACQ3G7_24720, partial [Kosakonia oryzendophytica]|uniref:hypothetical protein n=1 Tax=Kosakonia oryzendophytica TaxID=1005665 RepID=UPI003D33F68F
IDYVALSAKKRRLSALFLFRRKINNLEIIKKTAKEFFTCVDNNYDGDEAAGAYRKLHLLIKDKYHGCY